MTPESKIKKDICEYLTSIPCVFSLTTNIQASRKMSRSRYNVAGWGDITGCLRGGRFFMIEVKTPDGIISAAQKNTINQLNALGAIAFVARSVEDVKEILACIA